MKIINYFKSKLSNIIFSIPILQKPLPKNPFGKKPISSKKNYLKLFEKAKKKKYPDIDKLEEELGFSVDKNWFYDLCLVTQTCIKKSNLNYNHGRILYSLVSKYIELNKEDNLNITILETGTARGFSSICMSKAINDSNYHGKIITLDCIAHNQKIYWNSITDFAGKKDRAELLKKWSDELSNIIFLQGWNLDTLSRIGIERINFAFLDAQHTKISVLEEFNYIYPRQKNGDIIFLDDVTPDIFNGVCEAVNEIETNFPYRVDRLNANKKRGYAIATRI